MLDETDFMEDQMAEDVIKEVNLTAEPKGSIMYLLNL